MRFAIAILVLLWASPGMSAGIVPLGGDPIGRDSTTTDGNGAANAGRLGSEDNSLGQPGVEFFLDGKKRLVTLRAIVTFMNRNGDRLQVPNHRFWARLWHRSDYLAGKPFLQEIELGPPEGVEFQTLTDGSIVPTQRFGAAEANIPKEWPSYDFRWDLSSHPAFASPLPAGHYVLAFYSLSDADADGECLVGITREPTGFRPVFFSNSPCEYGPTYFNSACCPTSHLKWAITLYAQEECCGECLDPCLVECCVSGGGGSAWGSIHGIGVGDSLGGGFAPTLLSSLNDFSSGFPGGGGLGGFPGGDGPSPFSPPSSMIFPNFTPIQFSNDISIFPGSSNDFPPPPGGPPDDILNPQDLSPIPEPSSIILFALGALLLLALSRAKSLSIEQSP